MAKALRPRPPLGRAGAPRPVYETGSVGHSAGHDLRVQGPTSILIHVVERVKRTEKVLEQVTSHASSLFPRLRWGHHRVPLRETLSCRVRVNKALGVEEVPPERKPGARAGKAAATPASPSTAVQPRGI